MSNPGVAPRSGNVIDITGMIAIRVRMEATVQIVRRVVELGDSPPPEQDLALVYHERRRALKGLGGDEPHFRAFDFTVNFCRQHCGHDLETAKALVRAAIAKAAAQG